MQQRAIDVDRLIETLERFRTGTGMFIYPEDVPNAMSFLHGFGLALHTLGARREMDVWWQVQNDRGWRQDAEGPVPQMQKQGMTVRQIIDELVYIEIETLRRCNSAS